MSAALKIEKAAVLGAGVMGSQISALLANAGLQVDLLDVPQDGDGTSLARAGIERSLKGRPPAFFLPSMARRIVPGSLEDLDCLAEVDWVIEAIVEDLPAKKALLARVDEVAGPDLVVSSNTSGLSVNALVEGCSANLRKRFLGTHFFNPPRYMKLVEIVPGADTDPGVLEEMKRFLREELGKSVVEALDTPNFIANRLGIFTLMEALQRMEREGLGVEEVDAATGPLLGRPASATLRLCDIIGLDTLLQVARTGYENLPEDSGREVMQAPGFVHDMVRRGFLGAKAGAGFYRKTESGIEALDLETFSYRGMRPADLGELRNVGKGADLGSRLQAVWDDRGKLGAYGRANLLQVLAYAADHAAEMASDILQVDRAMRWGFNWEAGPFEMWDLLGAERVASRIEAVAGRTPHLAHLLQAAEKDRFYRESSGRRWFFAPARGEYAAVKESSGLPGKARILLENEGASLLEVEDGIGLLVLQGKMSAVGPATLDLVRRIAEEQPCSGLVLSGEGGLFSVGADLKYLLGLIDNLDWDGIESFLRAFQDAVVGLRYAPFPVVAAPRGMALGGGCEFCLGADARVAAAELRMGLVETRVGLIPGAGGCVEVVRSWTDDPGSGFDLVFSGRISDNAHQARDWRFLRREDPVLMSPERLLPRALEEVRKRAAGYDPPVRTLLPVAGSAGLRELEERMESRAGELAPYDRVVGRALARVLCGGEGPPRRVEEQSLLDLERESFLHLCGQGQTRERIAHMLKTGKPLRN